MSKCSIFSGKRYSNAQIRQLLAQAGWESWIIPLVAAVVQAESGGDPGAMNICGESSIGLLQVNQDSHNYPTNVLTDPLSNLRIAHSIYQIEGAKAWTNSWVRGGWRKYAQGDEVTAPNSRPSGGGVYGNPNPAIFGGSTPAPADDFSKYLGISVVGDKNRYLLAFAILVIIFIFAFN